MYNPFIVGKTVYLRGVEKKDLSTMFQWANDSEVTRLMIMGFKPNNIELMEEEYNRSIRSNNEIVLLIVDKKTEKIIGTTGFYMMNWVTRSAEYRILIGEKDFWGKGHGSEVANLMLTYAFDKLNLEKVWLGVNVENKAALKSYENAGYVKEGVLRKEIYRNGVYYDAVRMSVLREEYYKKKK